MQKILVLALFGWVSQVFANPYPDPRAVPRDPWVVETKTDWHSWKVPATKGKDILRVQFAWDASSDTFKLSHAVKEASGTAALQARSRRKDALGSYQAVLWDKRTDKAIGYASIGTGRLFRQLTRSLTFRFPMPADSSSLEVRLTGENPSSGRMEPLLTVEVPILTVVRIAVPDFETRAVRAATTTPSLVVGIYAEGYTLERKPQFFQHAEKAVKALQTAAWPEFSRMEFVAVFGTSDEKLGSAKKLGTPIKRKDSFLGLYFPYWMNFGRWYNVVYPTDENYFRANLASVPYDYPIVLVDSSAYWGVGNFNELTAVPALHPSFTYLLTHELGHFFGLNEEYEGGGRTELEFAPQIGEPWSQNITFHPKTPKWAAFVASSTPLPTPDSMWSRSSRGPIGAYRGGYADSAPSHSHKPGFNCTMSNGRSFCPVCASALSARAKFDVGL